MKILLFGGTFDPPHFGHIELLKSSIETVNPDKVVIMPTGIPPHKYAKAASAHIRLEMCKCFLNVFGNLQIDDEEIKRGGKSFTVDTVAYLQNKYKGAEIAMSLGSDMILMFHEWHKYEELLENVQIVVHCRASEDILPVQKYVQNLNSKGADVVIAKARIKEISSTEIREMVAQNSDISKLVPLHVEQCIKKHNIYSSEN